MNLTQIKTSGKTFFNGNGEPVEPKIGDWFCECVLEDDGEGGDMIEHGALVEYLGQHESHTFNAAGDTLTILNHRVKEEDDDSDRKLYGDFAIRQNY